MDRGAWRTTVHGVAKSWTQLSATRTHKLMQKACREAGIQGGSLLPLLAISKPFPLRDHAEYTMLPVYF